MSLSPLDIGDKLPSTKLDSIREHELYRYYQPLSNPSPPLPGRPIGKHELSAPENLPIAAPPLSPDTTLTALAQLCAIRLQASRAMISVIDKHLQYFIAEATKTLDLSDTSKCDKDGDGLWVGCTTVDKAGRLCEQTITAKSEPGHFSHFTISNLSKDSRFNTLPFVTGPPHFIFYSGVPLITKRGIAIGSLFILDHVERPPPNPEELNFMGTLAQTVMRHMEINAEAAERKKVMRLSMGMNAFVEGKARLGREHIPEGVKARRTEGAEGTPGKGKKSSFSAGSLANQSAPKSSPHLHASDMEFVRRFSLSEDSHSDSETPVDVDISHGSTLERAGNILYDSLDLNGHGGVVFFDTTKRRRPNLLSSTTPGLTTQSAVPAEVISSFTREPGVATNRNSQPSESFIPLDEDLLQNILRRYPQGKLWSFDGDSILSSDEDEDMISPKESSRLGSLEKNPPSRKATEALKLRALFPEVRQLLFYGLWDAGSDRWFAASFAWTTSARQVFSVETELVFFMAFGNNVMAQVSRLASIAADRQKADFIGSISHELRSPLHGILASAEFLTDGELPNFQASLVDTISSCGRTLLDTINHILDYSKINSFERTWRNSKKGIAKSKTSGKNMKGAADKDAPPMLNIWAITDVAAIAEEVIEGVYAGQIYQDISSADAGDFYPTAKATPLKQGIKQGVRPRGKQLNKNIEVIVDIEPEDYTFVAQPGALRRVIMNVFGNALKYTQQGTIKVTLSLGAVSNATVESSGADDPLNKRMLEIKIADTGKGISRQYLRTSLFNPFCQEDVLASGTGLGLSIVRSIVTMLQGTIDVQSEVGVGTEVTIRLPLSRIPGSDTPVATPSSHGDSGGDDSIQVLAHDYPDASVAFYGFETESNGISSVLNRYVHDWYGLRSTFYSKEDKNISANVVVVDARSLDLLINQVSNDMPIVLLCSNNTMPKRPLSRIEYVIKPFGPHKLAKALRVCLDGGADLKHGFADAIRRSSDSAQDVVSEQTTSLQDLERLTLKIESAARPIEVQTNGTITASNSHNALMALDSLSPDATSGDITVTGDNVDTFPFSKQDDKGGASPHATKTLPPHWRPQHTLGKRITEPITSILLAGQSHQDANSSIAAQAGHPIPKDMEAAKTDLLPNGAASILTASNIALHNNQAGKLAPVEGAHKAVKRPPRLLLVDDNKINLKLLETFMKRRKYQFVDSAENGQLAVEAAGAHTDGYDIIFMDISMPVMNGFEATRAIRDIEEEQRSKQKQNMMCTPALIIALTGLASERDQAEAFACGVDLFLTKPVSFKEVGKLLDNWESHGGLESQEGTD